VAPVLEFAPVADRGNHSCRDLRANALDASNALSQRTGSKGFVNTAIEDSDSPVDLSEEIKELRDRLARCLLGRSQHPRVFAVRDAACN
jgi:hypothetical protein